MTCRVIAAWTSSSLIDYPDYVTITKNADRITIKIRGSEGSKDVTQVTMDRQAFLVLASHALTGAIT